MADTTNLIKIQDVVDSFIYKYKLPLEDWDLYFWHVTDWWRDANIHHMRSFKTKKVSSVSSGIFDIPDDCIDIMFIAVPWNGRLWTLTKDSAIDITTIEGYPNKEVDSGLVYMEEFLDRETVERNGGTLGPATTIVSGKAVLNGIANYYVSLPVTLPSKPYTIEMGITVDTPTDISYILDFTSNGGTGSVTMSGGAIIPTSGAAYVNGVATNSVGSAGDKHIVIRGITLDSYTMMVGKSISDTNYFEGDIDYIRIYDSTWSTTDVTSAYTTHAARSATSAEDLLNYKTTEYGAVGGNNDYNFLPDWDRRKVYINGIPSGTVIMTYISSGISLTGDTYIPAHTSLAIDRWLRLRQAEIEGLGINERQLRRREYDHEMMMLRRINLPSSSEFKDILLGLTTQTPIR